MEFDWTSFALEVLNFLVLVWLLKRFFYRPVLSVIEARQAATAKTIAAAEATRQEAEQLKGDYQTRLADVDKDRSAAKAELDRDIANERARRLAAVEVEVNADRERRQLLETREKAELQTAMEREALNIAARFASRFLERLAGPELNARLADLTLSELEALPAEKLDALRDATASIRVVSAYALSESQRAAFTQTLARLAGGRTVLPEFSEDSLLKAGVCIMVGSWVLMANLRDELGFFSGSLAHGS